MWALRKKEADLTDEEKAVLEKLFKYSPRSKQAHLFRDQLTAIYDKDITRFQAKHLLNGGAVRVKHSEVRCFDGFVKMLMARKDEISNYFLERHTSGFVEGLNNKIKVIKRRCYGILNAGHLFQRIYLDLVGYKLYAQKIRGLRRLKPLLLRSLDFCHRGLSTSFYKDMFPRETQENLQR